MNPMISAWLGTVARAAMLALSGWVVQHGVLTEDQMGKVVEATAIAAPALAWSLYQKYNNRQKLVVAMSSPKPQSEEELEEHILDSIAAGVSLPSTTTPKNETPRVA